MSTWLAFVDISEIFDIPKQVDEIENLIRVPMVRQPNDYSCGACCVQSLLAYYGVELDQKTLEKDTNTSKESGADHRDIIKFLQSKGLEVELQKGMLLSDLQSFIDDGIPVIVMIQAWGKSVTDLEKTWENGHYVLAIGYDEDNVYFMDPSILGNYAYLPSDEFVKRWHDQDMDIKLRQAGIIVQGTQRYYADSFKRIF